jgi:hypothetical protein
MGEAAIMPAEKTSICECGARIRRVRTGVDEIEIILDYNQATVYQLDGERKKVVGASYGYKMHECAKGKTRGPETQMDLSKTKGRI